jgi:transglutaminase-like putative cysteine protease
MIRRTISCFAVFLFAALAQLAATPNAKHRAKLAANSPATRKFSFTYEVHVPANTDAVGPFYLWIPLPREDGFQDIEDLKIDSAVTYTKGRDPEYGNSFALFRPTAEQLASGFAVSVRFVVTRFEHRVELLTVSTASNPAPTAVDPLMQRYLEPDKLVPLNGVIAQLAKEHTAGDTTDLAKAHHIYDYVVSTMHYDKTGEGWGRGDAVWACSSKRGNCTDFHSLFIGMMRASGIPARFEIGFPLPDSKTVGEIPGYHCWAEFYLKGTGWVPVDASEASKNPDRRDYFFGAHDANRVFFTYGRDIRLSPEQHGDPLNYFIYPYAELNGKPFSGLQTHFTFNDLAVSYAARAK